MNLQAVPVGDSKVRQRLYESGRWTHGIIPFGNGRQVLHCMSIYGFAGAVGSSAIAEKKRNLSYRCCLKYSRTTIWQTHIEQWYGESDTPQPQPTVTPAAPATESQPIIKRGHVLKLIPSGGIFCCRCGRSTKLVKHQRLKILNKVCTFPDLPPEEWLTAPGFRNDHSLAAAEKELNDKHNKGNHQLVWNRKVGKDKSKSNFGKLWCSACSQEWPWYTRFNNSIHTMCQPIAPPPEPPIWVALLSHFSPKPPSVSHDATSSTCPPPRRRIRGKESLASQTSTVAVPGADSGIVDNPSSSSGLSHRRGVG